MTTLATVFRTLVGLFVDDGALALAIIVIVLLSWIFTALFPDLPLAAGAILLVGSRRLSGSPVKSLRERAIIRFGSEADAIASLRVGLLRARSGHPVL